MSAATQQQVEGRSLVPLLKNPKAEWAERTLVHHTGRWAKGKIAESKYARSGIQNSRFSLVNNDELYDLKADPGEQTNVIARHPEVVAKLRAAYDQWWTEVQPLLVNEAVTNAPSINPFQELYYKQFGGSPTAAALKRMDPKSSPDGEGAEAAPRKGRAKAAK